MKPDVVVSSQSSYNDSVRCPPVTGSTPSQNEKNPRNFRNVLKSAVVWRPWNPKLLRASGHTSIAVVPLVLMLWVPLDAHLITHHDIFKASPIGGNMSLTQAKAIDFVASAIMAPLLLALFNYIWFSNARVSIIDEKTPPTKGIPLLTMVEAAGTSCGSYDVFKIWNLCTSASKRLVLLAMLTLIAALAKSSLSNIIAYEAFMYPIGGTPVQLRLLRGTYVDFSGALATDNGSLIEANPQQRKNCFKQLDELDTELVWQNTTLVLDKGAYVAPNATKGSLSKLDGSITFLNDVPALRATIHCKPHTVQSFAWSMGWGILIDVPMDLEMSDDEQPGWAGRISQTFQSFYVNVNGRFSITPTWLPVVAAGRNITTDTTFIGVIATNFSNGWQDPQNWIPQLTKPVATAFGEVQATVLNLTEIQLDHGTNASTCEVSNACMAVIFGMICSVDETSGRIDLERSSADGAWTTRHQTWNEDTHARGIGMFDGSTVFPSAISCAYDPDLGEHPECKGVNPSVYPDRGPILGLNPKDYDFPTLAHNFLYRLEEIQRIGYEAGAVDTSQDTPDLFTTVTGSGGAQRYRMTYIPALLIAGLVSLFLAATVTVSLMLLSKKTQSVSYKQFRMVDSLRLLVDAVAGLRHEDFHHGAKTWTNEELESWAKQFMLRYDVARGLGSSSERSAVELSPVPTSPERG